MMDFFGGRRDRPTAQSCHMEIWFRSISFVKKKYLDIEKDAWLGSITKYFDFPSPFQPAVKDGQGSSILEEIVVIKKRKLNK
jgi:hypothetical protein